MSFAPNGDDLRLALTKTSDKTMSTSRPYRIVDLNYVTLYVRELPEAIDFYTRVFGPPDSVEENESIHGWRMGSTWLTLFPSSAGTVPESNPRNAEFAVQVSAPEEVDALYAALLDAGAKVCMAPRDTTMYVPMRFGCVDDPFGIRIDVYVPL